MSENFSNLIENPEKLYDLINGLVGENYSGSVGIRASRSKIKLGELKSSYVWNDGKRTNERLNGTCALIVAGSWWDGRDYVIENIREHAIRAASYGENIALIVGDDSEGGEDIGEIIISNAKAIYVF